MGYKKCKRCDKELYINKGKYCGGCKSERMNKAINMGKAVGGTLFAVATMAIKLGGKNKS